MMNFCFLSLISAVSVSGNVNGGMTGSLTNSVQAVPRSVADAFCVEPENIEDYPTIPAFGMVSPIASFDGHYPSFGFAIAPSNVSICVATQGVSGNTLDFGHSDPLPSIPLGHVSKSKLAEISEIHVRSIWGKLYDLLQHAVILPVRKSQAFLTSAAPTLNINSALGVGALLVPNWGNCFRLLFSLLWHFTVGVLSAFVSYVGNQWALVSDHVQEARQEAHNPADPNLGALVLGFQLAGDTLFWISTSNPVGFVHQAVKDRWGDVTKTFDDIDSFWDGWTVLGARVIFNKANEVWASVLDKANEVWASVLDATTELRIWQYFVTKAKSMATTAKSKASEGTEKCYKSIRSLALRVLYFFVAVSTTGFALSVRTTPPKARTDAQTGADNNDAGPYDTRAGHLPASMAAMDRTRRFRMDVPAGKHSMFSTNHLPRNVPLSATRDVPTNSDVWANRQTCYSMPFANRAILATPQAPTIHGAAISVSHATIQDAPNSSVRSATTAEEEDDEPTALAQDETNGSDSSATTNNDDEVEEEGEDEEEDDEPTALTQDATNGSDSSAATNNDDEAEEEGEDEEEKEALTPRKRKYGADLEQYRLGSHNHLGYGEAETVILTNKRAYAPTPKYREFVNS